MNFDSIYKAASIFNKMAQVGAPAPVPMPGGGEAEPLSQGTESYETDAQATAIQNAILGMIGGFNDQKYNVAQGEDPGYAEFVTAAQRGIPIGVTYSNGNYNIQVQGVSQSLAQEIQTYLATHLPTSSYQGRFTTNVTWKAG